MSESKREQITIDTSQKQMNHQLLYSVIGCPITTKNQGRFSYRIIITMGPLQLLLRFKKTLYIWKPSSSMRCNILCCSQWILAPRILQLQAESLQIGPHSWQMGRAISWVLKRHNPWEKAKQSKEHLLKGSSGKSGRRRKKRKKRGKALLKEAVRKEAFQRQKDV